MRYEPDHSNFQRLFTGIFLFIVLGIIITGWVLLIPRLRQPQPSETNTPESSPPVVETAVSSPSPLPENPPTAAPSPTLTAAASTPNVMEIFPTESSEYLSNPGIGWQFDGGAPDSSSFLPERVTYIRSEISWKSLNPQENVYDWSVLDQRIDMARSSGKDAAFRVFTMIGEVYGGHAVPAWVLEKGAVILPSGEPDYANCVYQQEWSRFVAALIEKYDGSSDVAFIDISGYGNFNEWSWQDQTEWDDQWDDDYRNGSASPDSFRTLDGQARRRLADMFIGSSFSGHQCRAADGSTASVDYTYPGFTRTQLVMPFAGIVQSTQYVFIRTAEVGFRYDCLGRDSAGVINDLQNELAQIWQTAPVVFEFCKPHEIQMPEAQLLQETAHGSLVHNNEFPFGRAELEDLLLYAGYRYTVKSARVVESASGGGIFPLEMTWQNVGNAPYYPRMGHTFLIHYTLVDAGGNLVLDYPVESDIAAWMPGEPVQVNAEIHLPPQLQPGEYSQFVAIVDGKTNEHIHLAVEGMDEHNRLPLPPLRVK